MNRTLPAAITALPAAVTALLAATALVAGGSARADCRITRLMELPVSLAGNRAVVAAKVNGVAVPMVIDTGSFFNSLSRDTTRLLKLDVGRAPDNMIVNGVGGPSFADITRAEDFTIGRQTFHRVDFIVVGQDHGSSRPSGYLGQNFLRLADDEFDLLNGVVRLMRTEGCADTNLAYWRGQGDAGVMDMQPSDLEHPHIIAAVKIDGARLHIMLDSGASTSVLSLHAAASVGITPDTPGAVNGGFLYGSGPRPVESWIVPVQSLTIDTEQISHTRVRIAPLQLLNGAADMILGADFFLSHRIFISYQQRKVFFTYNGGPVFDLSVHRAPGDAGTPAGAAAQAGAGAVSATAGASGQAASAPATAAAPATGAGAGADTDAPTDAQGFRRRGIAFAARGELDRASADFEHAMQLDPTDALMAYDAGLARFNNHQPQQARTDLDRAISLKPGYSAALLLRGRVGLVQHDDAAASADFGSAVARDPGNPELPLAVAAAYLDADRFDAALPMLDGWIAAHPDDRGMARALAERCRARGSAGRDLDGALADCTAALRTNSRNPAWLAYRALVRLRRGELAQAITDYDAALSGQSNLAPALYGRGLAKLRAGQNVQGQADLRAATAIQPAVAERFRRLGLAP
ncbi:MAG TPA: aspartyl protease family protein [Steroidobacteraceae bacterium]|nr:aspartyl protease family protein [Steroidobacteraceae bacterium]